MGRVEAQPFVPDADYCAYCHAPAAGPCAECGALCCGDCVEVVLRFTSQRAVCKPCIAAHGTSPVHVRPWIVAGMALLVGIGLLLYRFG
jgi:hypothetical protein